MFFYLLTALALSDSISGAIWDTRGIVAVDPVDKRIVVSFRGSSSVRNWIAE
jgi:hypothetical protein